MAHRVRRTKSDRFFVDADLPPADPGRPAHPRRATRHRAGRRRRLGRDSTGQDVFGVLVQYPGSDGAIRDPRPVIDAVQAAGRPRRRRHRPAGPDAPHPARRAGCRHRPGLGPALRRADGLWRPARRLLRHQGRPQARHARPDHRRLGRRPRPARAAHGAADPRAAHPPRQGDLQHLHRPGAAGGHGRLLRRLARARGPDPHRAPRPRAHRHPRRRPARELGIDGRHRGLLRHAHPVRSPAAPTSCSSPPATPASTCAWSTPTAWASRSTRPPPGDDLRRLLAAFGAEAARIEALLEAAYDDAFVATAASPAPRPSSPTRCSTLTAARPRCCATCAASRPRTSRSTAP